MQKAPTFVEAFAVWMMTERSFHRKVNVLNGHSRDGTDASASDGWQESRPKTQKALTFVKAFAVWTMTERSFQRKVNVLNGHSREGTDASASGGWQESRPRMQKAPTFVEAFAVWTGLEPATPCVTGRYSNQLNYQTFIFRQFSAMAKVTRFFIKYNDLYNNLFTSIL